MGCSELRDKKVCRVAVECNPNVLSLLWLPKRHLIFEHELGSLLRENRQLFATKAAYHSFNGYAYAQFKRMTHLNQETQAEMARLEEELERHGIDLTTLRLDQAQRDTVIESGLFDGERLGLIADRYKGLKRQYYSGGYMGAKRRELVRRVGYDAKNAAHLIRLLRMGIEFLVEGDLHVERNDAEQLLEIKRGEWSLDRVKEESERLFRLAEEAYVRSSLPAKPDTEKAEGLCMEIVTSYHDLVSNHCNPVSDWPL